MAFLLGPPVINVGRLCTPFGVDHTSIIVLHGMPRHQLGSFFLCFFCPMEYRASGHLSREGSFTSRHGRPGRALSSPDTWVPHHGDTRYANGFSSSCHDDQHSNYRHSPQPSLMQNGGSGGRGGGVGGGGGGGGSGASRNLSVHQQSPQPLHMGDRGAHDQTDLRDEVVGPSRSGMTVQDLKQMTAIRMGQQSIGGRGGGGAGRGGSGGGGNVGSVSGALGEGKGSVLSSTSGSPPPDLLSGSSRHRTGLLHHSSTGRDTSPRPTATAQHMLRVSAPSRESRQEPQRQQHDLPPPPGVLSRHASAHAAVGGSPRYSHHHQQPNGSRGQMPVSVSIQRVDVNNIERGTRKRA